MRDTGSSKVCVLGYDDRLGLPILGIEEAYPRLYRSLRQLFEDDLQTPVIFFCARCTQVTNSLLPVETFIIITSECLYRATKEGVVNKCVPVVDVEEIIQSDDFWIGLKIPAHYDFLMKPISPKDSRDLTDVLVKVKGEGSIRVKTISHGQTHIKGLLDTKKPKGYVTKLKKIETRNILEEIEPSSPFSPDRDRSMSRLDFDVKKRASLMIRGEGGGNNTTTLRSSLQSQPDSPTSASSPLTRFFTSIDTDQLGVITFDELVASYRAALPPGIPPPPKTTPAYFVSLFNKLNIDTTTGISLKTFQRVSKEFTKQQQVSIQETDALEEMEKKMKEMQQELVEVRRSSQSPRGSDELAKKVERLEAEAAKVHRLEQELKEVRSNSTKSNEDVTTPVGSGGELVKKLEVEAAKVHRLERELKEVRSNSTKSNEDVATPMGSGGELVRKLEVEAAKVHRLERELKEVRSNSTKSNEDGLSKAKELKEARSNSTRSDATLMTVATESPVVSPVDSPGFIYISSPLLRHGSGSRGFPSPTRRSEAATATSSLPTVFHTALVLNENFRDQKQAISTLKSKGIMAQPCVTMADALPLLHTAHILIISSKQAAQPSVASAVSDLKMKPQRPLVVCLTSAGSLPEQAISIMDRATSLEGLGTFIDEVRSKRL